MDLLAALCIISVSFTGFSKGSGVLPDGSLVAPVGGTVMFTTTLTPTETPFVLVAWSLTGDGAEIPIISSTTVDTTGPGYEGRITLFRSTGSLEIRNLPLNETGTYRVSIVNAEGLHMTGSTELEILEPVSNVVVTSSSTDLVEFNSSVSLSCSSSGTPISFLWLNGSKVVTPHEGVLIPDGGNNLTIVNVTRYDQGPFRCNVSNAVSNSISDPVNFTISYGPENINLTTSHPQEYHEKGSNISLSCSAVSSPSALFQWVLNEVLTDTGPELRLINLQESQSGNYSCQAFNDKTLRYVTSQSAAVTVLERISGASVTSSTNQPIEGTTVNLTCDAAGSVFTREWMKNGLALIPTDNVTLYDDDRVLSFLSLRTSDSGEYSCTISNPINSLGAEYNMIVNYGPDSVQIKGPSVMNIKQTLTLTCSAASTPTASYTWTLNGTEIHNSDTFIKTMTEVSDSGTYICEAVNNVTGRSSSAEHRLSVTGEELPPSSSCSAGCIAGIVIACVVVCAAVAGGGIYCSKKRKGSKESSNRSGGEGNDNSAYSGSQELNYVDIRVFQKKDGGTVPLGSQEEETEYAQVRVNSGPPAASSPPTYDAHLQRVKNRAPQPGANAEPIYAQARKK